MLSPLYFLASLALASWDCGKIENSGKVWNLTDLPTQNMTLMENDHEGISIDKWYILFNICNPLGSTTISTDLVPDEQTDCKTDAYGCRIITNTKKGDRRVISAKLYSSAAPFVNSNESTPDVLKIQIGTNYSIGLEVKCDPNLSNNEPAKFKDFKPAAGGRGGQLSATLTFKYCPTALGSGVVESTASESWIWWLFKWSIYILAGYFIVGIGLNYYNNREFALPHASFWAGLGTTVTDFIDKMRGRNSQYVAI